MWAEHAYWTTCQLLHKFQVSVSHFSIVCFTISSLSQCPAVSLFQHCHSASDSQHLSQCFTFSDYLCVSLSQHCLSVSLSQHCLSISPSQHCLSVSSSQFLTQYLLLCQYLTVSASPFLYLYRCLISSTYLFKYQCHKFSSYISSTSHFLLSQCLNFCRSD